MSPASPDAPGPRGSIAVAGRLAANDPGPRARPSGDRPIVWQIAEEVPVSLCYDGRPHAVMMTTPTDLEDFARGFSLSEGLVGSIDEIERIQLTPARRGLRIDLHLAPAALPRTRLAATGPRAIEGRSGCGLCGVRTLDEAFRPFATDRLATGIPTAALLRAFDALPDAQPLNRENRSVHAAAWCSLGGEIELVREDVGRHNALDKLIGARLVAAAASPGGSARAFADGFVVMTSRCSFELVQKCAVVGITCLATVSAPTSLALDVAREAGLRVVVRAEDGIVSFGGPEDVTR